MKLVFLFDCVCILIFWLRLKLFFLMMLFLSIYDLEIWFWKYRLVVSMFGLFSLWRMLGRLFSFRLLGVSNCWLMDDNNLFIFILYVLVVVWLVGKIVCVLLLVCVGGYLFVLWCCVLLVVLFCFVVVWLGFGFRDWWWLNGWMFFGFVGECYFVWLLVGSIGFWWYGCGLVFVSVLCWLLWWMLMVLWLVLCWFCVGWYRVLENVGCSRLLGWGGWLVYLLLWFFDWKYSCWIYDSGFVYWLYLYWIGVVCCSGWFVFCVCWLVVNRYLFLFWVVYLVVVVMFWWLFIIWGCEWWNLIMVG